LAFFREDFGAIVGNARPFGELLENQNEDSATIADLLLRVSLFLTQAQR
jgi:hypothetical protein